MVAAALVGSAVVGGAASASASHKQSKAAKKAAKAAAKQNQLIRDDNEAWRTEGGSAVHRIGDLLGTSGNKTAEGYGSLSKGFDPAEFQKWLQPNYDFMLQQGLGATQNAGNAAGFSGNTLKGINDYAQGFAGNAYQQALNNYTANQTNTYNRLSNLAGLGQTANQTTAYGGTKLTDSQIGAQLGGANAQAAGAIGLGNAFSNGLSNYAGWNYLNGSPNGRSGAQAAFSNTGLGSSGFGSGLAYGNGDLGQEFADGGPVRGYAWGGPISKYAAWGGPARSLDAGESLMLPAPMPSQPSLAPSLAPSVGRMTIQPTPRYQSMAPISAMTRMQTPKVPRWAGYEAGGEVSGPGGPRDDAIPAMLSDGEHVFDADAVNAMGDGDNEIGQMRLTRLRDMLKRRAYAS